MKVNRGVCNFMVQLRYGKRIDPVDNCIDREVLAVDVVEIWYRKERVAVYQLPDDNLFVAFGHDIVSDRRAVCNAIEAWVAGQVGDAIQTGEIVEVSVW